MTERVQGPAFYFPSIEKKYGRPISYWLNLISSCELTKHKALVDWLKADHGLGHFSLATGAGREWVWPGRGMIGQISLGVGGSGSNSWEADNRTLLFEVTTRNRTGNTPGQLRLLDTAAPGGSLLASSTRIPPPGHRSRLAA